MMALSATKALLIPLFTDLIGLKPGLANSGDGLAITTVSCFASRAGFTTMGVRFQSKDFRSKAWTGLRVAFETHEDAGESNAKKNAQARAFPSGFGFKRMETSVQILDQHKYTPQHGSYHHLKSIRHLRHNKFTFLAHLDVPARDQ